MVRTVVIILVVATVIGALMPSGPIGPVPADAPDRTRTLTVGSSRVDGESSDPEQDGSVTLDRSADGHFYADARVNGSTIRFLVDTGATGVALARDDARRAGVSFSESSFEPIGQGASGEVRGQPVSLDRIRLGHREAEDLPAVVLEGGDRSLLGQNFLRRFRSVAIEGDRMVLR